MRQVPRSQQDMLTNIVRYEIFGGDHRGDQEGEGTVLYCPEASIEHWAGEWATVMIEFAERVEELGIPQTTPVYFVEPENPGVWTRQWTDDAVRQAAEPPAPQPDWSAAESG